MLMLRLILMMTTMMMVERDLNNFTAIDEGGSLNGYD